MNLDLFVYHDMDDNLNDAPRLGDRADARFGNDYEGLYVVALAPGVHAGRMTVVLAHENRPEMMRELKEFVTAR